MPKYVITYDERAIHHDYEPLHTQLNSWNAGYLQNSTWLVELTGNAEEVRNMLQRHMHPDDTISVLKLADAGWEWVTRNVRREGLRWLNVRYPS